MSGGFSWALPLALLTVSLFAQGKARPDPAYCSRGLEIAGKYHDCWGRATHGNSYSFAGAKMYTPQVVTDYATHMCRVVKPIAMECLQKQLRACSEKDKLMQIADESGGACLHSDLSPFFKKYIIDYLKPIPLDSPCFQGRESSRKCYEEAGRKIIASGLELDNISTFHKVADKFFDYIWTCHIELFKANRDVCPTWQIPMLLDLQKTAMPSLFGMHLNNKQVAKLELFPEGNKIGESTTTPSPDEKGKEGCEDGDGGDKPVPAETYLMVRVITDKSQARKGDVVIQLTPEEDKTEMSVASGPAFNDEEHQLIQTLLNKKGQLDIGKLRRRLQEERKRLREQRGMDAFIKKIGDTGNWSAKEAAEAKLRALRMRKQQSVKE